MSKGLPKYDRLGKSAQGRYLTRPVEELALQAGDRICPTEGVKVDGVLLRGSTVVKRAKEVC